jgi:hypothetical protein
MLLRLNVRMLNIAPGVLSEKLAVAMEASVAVTLSATDVIT